MIQTFTQLIAAPKKVTPQRVVIAGCGNRTVIQAISDAMSEGFAIPVLVGTQEEVARALELVPESSQEIQVFTQPDENLTARKSVQLVRSAMGDILLKGSVSTTTLMQSVLDKETGIRGNNLMSDSFVFEYENRLVDITDGGVTLYPDVYQKQSILENAVNLYHALGYKQPKVAICAAVENVNEKMPPTLDAAELKKKYESGKITGCIVDGPLALDGALSKEALQIKGIESSLDGQADILIMPNIESANLVAKSTQYIAGKEAAHVIMGAQVPILIPSRSDTSRGKYLSIALASVVKNSFPQVNHF